MQKMPYKHHGKKDSKEHFFINNLHLILFFEHPIKRQNIKLSIKI